MEINHKSKNKLLIIFFTLSLIFQTFSMTKLNVLKAIGYANLIFNFFLAIIIIKNNFNVKKYSNINFWLYIFIAANIISNVKYCFGIRSIITIVQLISIFILINVFKNIYFSINNIKTICLLLNIYTTINFCYCVITNKIQWVGLYADSNVFGYVIFYFLLIKISKIVLIAKKSDYIFIILDLYLIYKSDTRMILIILMILIVIYLFLKNKQQLNIKLYMMFFLILILIMIGTIVMYIHLSNTEFGQQLNLKVFRETGKNLFSGRQYIWSQILNLLKNDFFIGLGSGALPILVGITRSCHNLYIQIILQTGLIGLIIFIIFLSEIYKNIYYLNTYNRNVKILIFVSIILSQMAEVTLTQNNFSIGYIQWFILFFNVTYNYKINKEIKQ